MCIEVTVTHASVDVVLGKALDYISPDLWDARHHPLPRWLEGHI